MKWENNEVSRFATQRTGLNANSRFEKNRRWAGLELITTMTEIAHQVQPINSIRGIRKRSVRAALRQAITTGSEQFPHIPPNVL
jgi:hypothetical protein